MLLTRSYQHFTISAFSTLLRAGETAVVSNAKDTPPNKTPRPEKNDSNARNGRETTAASSSQIGTTQEYGKLLENFAMMTPEQKEKVKRYSPDFHRVATEMAPLMLKGHGKGARGQSSPTLMMEKLLLEFAKMTLAEEEPVEKSDPVFRRVANRFAIRGRKQP
jgi:hypothetical protein